MSSKKINRRYVVLKKELSTETEFYTIVAELKNGSESTFDQWLRNGEPIDPKASYCMAAMSELKAVDIVTSRTIKPAGKQPELALK